MNLTWKDAVTTVLAGAIVAIYTAFLNGTGAWLISSARGTATAVLVLGVVACSFGTVADLYRRAEPPLTAAYAVVATATGVLALAAAVAALVTGSTVALAVLVAAALALWLMATARHVFTVPHVPAGGRETHEVIHPEKSPRR